MSQMSDPSSGSASTSPQLAASLQRAIVYAEEQAHRLVTAEHLLLALTEDADAVAVMHRKGIDLDQLRNEIAGIVSRNDDRFAYGDAGQPIYGADLLRVLNTASGAASARRPIDGALVLAAIIADGRTPAAEVIRLYGLTFEEASRSARPASGGHPSLASVRSLARELALGFRKRPETRTDANLGDDTVPLPPPLRQQQPALQAPQPETWRREQLSAVSNPATVPNGQWPAEANGAGWDTSGGTAATGGQWNDEVYAEQAPVAYTQPSPAPGDEPPALRPAPPPYPETAEPPTRRRRNPETEAVAPAPAPVPKTKGRRAATKPRRTDRGVLVENIPRRMVVGVPIMVEARIARQDLEAALFGFAGYEQSTAVPIPIAQTMTVRLRSIDGGAAIELSSPETQWMDGALGILDDEFASWRWTVTPKRAGVSQLQLIASTRAVAEDGLAAEAAIPDQRVEVRIVANQGVRFRQAAAWLAWTATAVAAGAIGEHVLHLIGGLLGR